MRFLLSLAGLAVMPLLLAANAVSLALLDLLWRLLGKRIPASSDPLEEPCRRPSLSVVIPTWNARDLLEKYLPSVVRAAAFHPDNEVIVVDNASSDGTAEFVRAQFPHIRLLALEENLGFGGGNNAGVAAARNDVVVVLNNDMRVEPEAFERLLEGFQVSPDVFAVSAQILFTDPTRRREETGLTEGDFRGGLFRVGHVIEDVPGLYPAFYAGGGSSAYDRKKFLELGGFDPLFHPFYMEDTDLSYNAWKRGWQVLYQPAAVVYHEHRGTIGKRFTPAQIEAVLKRNHVLMVWKNVHDWRWLASHCFSLWSGAAASWLGGNSPGRMTLAGYYGALRRWGAALAARWRARSLAEIGDREAAARSRAGVFRDRFLPAGGMNPGPWNILFVSPYSLYPPTHGGGVFMYQAVKCLARRHRVHVLAFVDRQEELESNQKLLDFAASVECVLRRFPPQRDYLGLLPFAVRSFASDDFRRRIDRALWRHDIDILQLEYTQLGQYGGGLAKTPSFLFEHDVYFQSVRRRLLRAAGIADFFTTLVEWLRALRYEPRMLRRMDVIQTCSEEERRLLQSILGEGGHPLIAAGLRAAVDGGAYRPVFQGRRPDTALFVGNFQHPPNREALAFLVQRVWPKLRALRPQAELAVAGAQATPDVEKLSRAPGVRFLGCVADIRACFAEFSVFLCPIFAGSGVRVKILEAWAAGMPVIATPLGAEGLEAAHGRELLLARSAEQFVSATLELFENPELAEQIARRARQVLEERWDWNVVMARLERSYGEALARVRPLVFVTAPPAEELPTPSRV